MNQSNDRLFYVSGCVHDSWVQDGATGRCYQDAGNNAFKPRFQTFEACTATLGSSVTETTNGCAAGAMYFSPGMANMYARAQGIMSTYTE